MHDKKHCPLTILIRIQRFEKSPLKKNHDDMIRLCKVVKMIGIFPDGIDQNAFRKQVVS